MSGRIGCDGNTVGESRRIFVGRAAVCAAGMVFAGAASAFGAQVRPRAGKAHESAEQGEPPEKEVSPAEDLMREHGVLRRVLLIYDDAIRRLDSAPADYPIGALAGAADIIRRFIEEYHEKLEEDHVFPRVKKAGRETELVGVLLAQHRAGRTLTDTITRLATPAGVKSDDDRRRLADALRAFGRMYRPHAAREDTVLFPAFKAVVGTREYESLGDEFEKLEHKLFGEDGFEGMVVKVSALEKQLGLLDLAQFTPPA